MGEISKTTVFSTALGLKPTATRQVRSAETSLQPPVVGFSQPKDTFIAHINRVRFGATPDPLDPDLFDTGPDEALPANIVKIEPPTGGEASSAPAGAEVAAEELPPVGVDASNPGKTSLLPAADDVLKTAWIINNELPMVPWVAGVNSALDQAYDNGTLKATVGDFVLGLLKLMAEAAQNIETMQENRGQLNQDGKILLGELEGFLPPEAKNKRLKADLLYKVIFSEVVDNWERKIHPNTGDTPTTVTGGFHPLRAAGRFIVGIGSAVLRLGKAKSQPEEPEEDDDEYDPAQDKMGPSKPNNSGKDAEFDSSLSRLMTAFIRRTPKYLDRTFPAFIKLLEECEGKPGVPKDITEASQFIRHLRGVIADAVTSGSVAKVLERHSVEGFRGRLSEIWDVPPEQRLMSKDQHDAVSRLIETTSRASEHSQSRENLVTQLYTILYEVPWENTPPRQCSKEDIRAELDKDHYGLEEVKTEIVDYMGKEIFVNGLIADKHMEKKEGEPTIICLVGPPGVGKTSLGQSIARAVGRRFVRVALGGVSDEAEIRGHNSTYVSSKPGRIVNGLIQARSRNPVFMLDEIDKLDKNSKGDPASALLEVLDPSQNKTFTDNYLGLATDLSDVIFICTANTTDTIPQALLDRMKVIDLKGYTPEEKVKIAQEHLIPRARRSNGLAKAILKTPEEGFTLSDQAILKIIEGYAPERGVRSLKNRINTLGTKIASQMGDLKRMPTLADFPTIHADNLRPYLGRAKYKLQKVDPEPMVGRAVGMFYSEGARPGGTLPVDVALDIRDGMPPEACGLHLGHITGNMQETMTQSATVAFDYVSSHKEELGVADILKKNKVIVHIGASDWVSKDGPSAGAALTLALISALKKKPLRGDMSMTGTINLHGQVGAIGGVREKVMGSAEEGVKFVMIPHDNEDDIEDIPENVRQGITLRTVKTMDDVQRYAFAHLTDAESGAPEAALPKFASGVARTGSIKPVMNKASSKIRLLA